MVFLDTNVLVYAALELDPRKQGIAAVLLEHFREQGIGVISLQILREFANALFHKSDYSPEQIRNMVDRFHAAYQCLPDSYEIQMRAFEIKSKYGLQFYDAIMLATAEAAGCDTVYSEDMGDGVVYDGITVKDPFKVSAPSDVAPSR